MQKYQVGNAVLSLGYPLLGSMTWRHLARPMMNDLADHAGGSVALSVRDRLHMVYVETSRSTSKLGWLETQKPPTVPTDLEKVPT